LWRRIAGARESATVRIVNRVVIIGDVHGCAVELRMLLAHVGLSARDRLVMVGDLVNKGPASLDVIQLVRSHRGDSVIGNHDQLLLQAIRAKGTKEADNLPEAIRKLAKRISPDDAEWLATRPTTISLPEHHALVVHAGLVPNVPISSQTREQMITMRSLRSDGTATKRIEEGVPWASLWPGPEHVYFGHDAVRGLQRWPYATGLDTGCVYGGRLTACILPERDIVSIPAVRTYAEPGRAVSKRLEK
jgi:hypothetical protein